MDYNSNNRYIIVPGRDNSIDTIASVIAYNEFLIKKGYKCRYYIEDRLSEQTRMVIDKFNIKLDINEYDYEDNDKFILIGANSKKMLPNFINKNMIETIISNNQKNEDNKSYCISSIVAYHFLNYNIDISKESAILLYFGIMDKTVNLKFLNTRPRDVEMFKWLEEKSPDIFKIDSIKQFYKKIEIIDKLKNEINTNTIIDNYKGKSIGISRLNFFNLSDILCKKEKEIIGLIKSQKYILDIDYLILVLNDFEGGQSFIVTDDAKCKELISNAIHVIFDNNISIYKRIISRNELRKRIVRLNEFKKKINKLTTEKCEFLTNTYWWIDVCINSMKNADIDTLEKKGFFVPDSNDWTKNKKMKKNKEKISEILDKAIYEDLYYTAFIYLVTIMEDYLCQIIKMVLEKDNRRILTNIKGINCKNDYELKDILKPNGNFIKDIIEDRVMSVMYASPKNQIEYFNKALGIEFENAEQWFEIKATRDVIVHNSGIINDVYINKSGEKARGKNEEKILITQDYFRESISFLKRSIIKISNQLKMNFSEQEKIN